MLAGEGAGDEAHATAEALLRARAVTAIHRTSFTRMEAARAGRAIGIIAHEPGRHAP